MCRSKWKKAIFLIILSVNRGHHQLSNDINLIEWSILESYQIWDSSENDANVVAFSDFFKGMSNFFREGRPLIIASFPDVFAYGFCGPVSSIFSYRLHHHGV
jgi:hypothetical protein